MDTIQLITGILVTANIALLGFVGKRIFSALDRMAGAITDLDKNHALLKLKVETMDQTVSNFLQRHPT